MKEKYFMATEVSKAQVQKGAGSALDEQTEPGEPAPIHLVLVQAGNREKEEESRWVEEHDAKEEVSRCLKVPQRAEGERVEESGFSTAAPDKTLLGDIIFIRM